MKNYTKPKIILLFWFTFSSIITFAQDRTVTGNVIDGDSNEPLPGVNIIIKGSGQGTVTDINGNYSITVPDNETVLVYRFVGFNAEEETVGNRSTIDVTLLPDIESLQEVVVIGYGTVKKRDLTGSVASVKAEEIVKTPTHNPMEAIQGRVSGVDIVRSSGSAGSGTEVRIRGNRSINGSNEPLYIIDGFQGGSINDVNPNDIESIDVLKDASATAIYGSQGANGVVIITTKRGMEGKPQISYNGFYGVNGLTPFPDRLTGEDYLQLRREAYRTTNGTYPTTDEQLFGGENDLVNAYQEGQWVDWVDELMRNGRQQSHTLSVRGGNESTKAFLSAGLFREEGMYRMNDMDRYNVRLNLDQKITSWAMAGLLSQVTYYDRNNRTDPLSAAISATPLGRAYDEFGNIIHRPIAGSSSVSPLADEIPNAAIDNTKNTNVSLNAYLELKPFNGLSFRSNFGSRLNSSRRGKYFDEVSYTQRGTGISRAELTTNFNRFYHWDNILTYSKNIDDHSFTITGITNYTQSDEEDYFMSGIGQVLSSHLFYNLGGTSPDGRIIESGYTRSNTMSYAGRLNYIFRDKYLITLTNRVDGSSVLSGRKFDAFPSVAAGWIISDESFMNNLERVDLLKLRGSYGLTGNSGIDAYGTQSLVVTERGMGFGDVAAPMYRFSTRVGNANLGWENSATINLGLDLGLFNNRLTASIDAYNTQTTDILFARTLPQSTGVVDVLQNVASTQNRGIELGLNSINFDNDNFRWATSATFTKNKEEITSLISDNDIISASDPETNSLLIGRPIQSFYSYKKLGIWQTDEADEAAEYRFGNENGPTFKPGDIRVEDVNGDKIIVPADDRQYLGSTVPKWIAGLRNSFRYKAFDLDIFLFARWGQMINAGFLGRYNPEGTGGSLSMFDYWTPENPTNDYPRPRRGSLSSIYGYQALPFVDGSYFKIRNVSIGYNLPGSVSERISAGKIRLYATGSNLLVISKSHLLSNYDPEGGGSENYPINRQIVVGVNVDF